MPQYILSIDQGTTGSRAFIFDKQGRVAAKAYKEFPQYFPKPGWVEHDADEIWASCVAVIKQAVAVMRRKHGSFDPSQITAIGITNQRETTIMWDRQTARPLHRAIVWQDRRTADICLTLKKHGPMVKKATGLVLDPYFSGTKVKWLLAHVPGLRKKVQQGQVCFGTVDSWIMYKLTAGKTHATDMTNAARTLLFDIHQKAWSKSLLKLFGIPEKILPEVKPSGSLFGHTAKVAGLPAGIPITGVMGDQQAALYGQGCFEAGSMKNTYGTGCFLVLNTGLKAVASKNGLLTTIACDAKGQPVYALEGAVFIAGAVVQWLRDELNVIANAAASEAMVRGSKDTNGVYFVPAFTGLGAPYWDPQARGTITGLTRGANVRHIVRAALEAIAYQTKDIVEAMDKDYGGKIQRLAVDGGACRNGFLMQFQADILSIVVIRPRMVDSTVAGAAHLAGVTSGLWQRKDLNAMRGVDREFKPVMPRKVAVEKYALWQAAVRKARA